MWRYSAETRTHWFPRGGGVGGGEAEYFLVGLVIGLALHNGLILDLRLPPLLYRRLLNEPVGLAQLREVEPDVARGLQLLLEQSPSDARVGAALRARLSFVDLAGSERVSGAGPSLERQHRKEMAAINVSLSALASCIAAEIEKT